uniref:Anthocyanin acyltransferase n=1 Tax=Glycine max TaxID=3847 RepID=A0A0R0IS18_SOYBN
MKVVQVLNVAPTLESHELPTQTLLPLTFFDILWLSHFFPLAGHLTWSLHSQNPIINYNNGDTVSLTVAESNDDFNHLACTDLCEAKEMHHLLPHLTISHEQATVLALQVTLFLNSGLCIRITSHYVALDGKTSISFIKSWAYLCKESQSPSCLPLEMCLFYDCCLKFINDWLKHGGSNSISLMVWDLQPSEDASRGSSKLSRSDVEKLKQSVVSKKKKNTNLHLSSFVLSIAYAWVCRVRAEEIKNKSVALALTVDCRWRLEPPLPATYFGNCVGFRLPIAETRELLGEEGLVVAVEAVSDTLETLKDGAVSGAENWSSWLLDGMGAEADVKKIGVAGSPRFEVYSSDFGWGRPKKVEMVSIEKTAVFGLSDSRNGDGIEIVLRFEAPSITRIGARQNSMPI